jgi:hypothetical protein
MNPIKKSENNSLLLFAGAFSLGAIFSYFASPSGSKKWQQLQEKWEEAKEYLWQQGLIKDKSMSLDTFRKTYLQGLADSFLGMKTAFESKTIEKELAHLAKLKRRRGRSKKQKFKGV